MTQANPRDSLTELLGMVIGSEYNPGSANVDALRTRLGAALSVLLGGTGTLGGATVTRNSNQSIPNSAVTAVSFDTEAYDTLGLWVVGSPTRFTIPTTGIYLFTGVCEYDTAGGGQGGLFIRRDGTTFLYGTTYALMGGGNSNKVNISAILSLSATQFIELCCFQNSGGAINIISPGTFGTVAASFAVERLR